MKKYIYKNKHLDLESESNSQQYINEISKEGWRLVFIYTGNKRDFAHPLCIFEKEFGE